MTSDRGPKASDTFSLAKLMLYGLASGAVVLVVAIPIVLVTAPHSPVAALIVALAAVAGMIVVIALVSRRMTAGLTAELEAQRARQRAAAGGSTEKTKQAEDNT